MLSEFFPQASALFSLDINRAHMGEAGSRTIPTQFLLYVFPLSAWLRFYRVAALFVLVGKITDDFRPEIAGNHPSRPLAGSVKDLVGEHRILSRRAKVPIVRIPVGIKAGVGGGSLEFQGSFTDAGGACGLAC